MVELNCGHDPSKVLRFAITDSDLPSSQLTAIISLCDVCFAKLKSLVTAVEDQPQAKYIDSPEVNRVFIPKGDLL